MKSEELVHIKIEYNEAVSAKRDILNTEADLLEIAKSIRQYKKIRSKELNLKLGIFQKLKLLKQKTNQLQQVLPKIKIPSLLKKDYLEKPKIENIEEKKYIPKEERYDRRLEEELREIQEKLKALH